MSGSIWLFEGHEEPELPARRKAIYKQVNEIRAEPSLTPEERAASIDAVMETMPPHQFVSRWDVFMDRVVTYWKARKPAEE